MNVAGDEGVPCAGGIVSLGCVQAPGRDAEIVLIVFQRQRSLGGDNGMCAISVLGEESGGCGNRRDPVRHT